jgi:hypothetical protein
MDVIELSCVIDYLHIGIVRSQSSTMCLSWMYVDFILYICTNVLILWFSIERHLLIFHSQIYYRLENRLIYHHCLTLIGMIYMILSYIGTIFINPCEQEFNFSQALCYILSIFYFNDGII